MKNNGIDLLKPNKKICQIVRTYQSNIKLSKDRRQKTIVIKKKKHKLMKYR